MEAHAAQDVQMVLMNIGGYELTEGGECAFVVGQKDCLNEPGVMDEGNVYTKHWDECSRRAWCNADYYNSFPQNITSIFRKMKTTSGVYPSNSAPVACDDYFALFGEKEVFNANTYEQIAAGSEMNPIAYYNNVAANRFKKINGIDSYWYLRSKNRNNGQDYCAVDMYSNPGSRTMNTAYGIAPFGCIGKKVV